MRNAYEGDLDRMEAAYRRDGEHWGTAPALAALGLLAAGALGLAVRSTVVMQWAGLTVYGLLILGLFAVRWRNRRRSLASLSRATTPLADMVGASERDVVIRGHLQALPNDRGHLIRCPGSPGVAGWIDTIELETWRANDRGRWGSVAGDTGPKEAEVIVAATAGPCENIPQALLDDLALGGYREPPHVVRLTGSRRAPVRIGVLPSKPTPLKVRVVLAPSEADAERSDVARSSGVGWERREARHSR